MSTRRITALLQDADAGRDGALDELMQVVHDDLQRMASNQLRRQFGARAGQITLEPAALVNEAFMRLIRQRLRFENRSHFFAIVTHVMLHVLVDYRRRRGAKKRGGDARYTLLLDAGDLRDDAERTPDDVIEIEALVAALERLDALSRRKADVVRMRVVWGLDLPTIAESTGVSLSTIERDWRFAKAWLAEEADGVEGRDGR